MDLIELNKCVQQVMRELVESDSRPPVEVTVNKRRGITMLVDPLFSWLAFVPGLEVTPLGYARRQTNLPGGKKQHKRISRIIAEACGLEIAGREVDHADLNKLNNTFKNLRVASRGESNRNRPKRRSSSGYTGVYRHGRRYQACIWYDGRFHHLGMFDDPTEAARVRDAAAIELHVRYANLNFPLEGGSDE